MSIADAARRGVKALADTFDFKPYDPEPGRKRVVRLLDNARDQYSSGKTKVPNRAWQTGHDSVKFTLTLNDTVIPIGDETTTYLPPQEFLPFLDDVKAGVNKGELDDEIKAALEQPSPGGGQAASSNRAPRTRARPTSAAGSDKPWALRQGWDSLSPEDKRAVSSRHRYGKNPDNSLIAEVGHKPDAAIVR